MTVRHILIGFAAAAFFFASTTESHAEDPEDPVVSQLRTQIEVMERYDQRLLETVYWSLGVLVTIAGVLIGFGWFANFRIYQRDKASLSAELSGNLQASVAQAELRLSHDLLDKFTEFSESTRQEVTREIGATKREIGSLSRSLETRFADVSYKFSEAESEKWIAEKVLTNALRAQFSMLEQALNLPHPFYASRALEFIHRTLNSIAQGGHVRPDADDIRRYTQVLESVPPEHAVVLEPIKVLLGRSFSLPR